MIENVGIALGKRDGEEQMVGASDVDGAYEGAKEGLFVGILLGAMDGGNTKVGVNEVAEDGAVGKLERIDEVLTDKIPPPYST